MYITQNKTKWVGNKFFKRSYFADISIETLKIKCKWEKN